MKQLHIIHLGLGNVGREVQQQVLTQKKQIEKRFGVSIAYQQTFTSKHSTEEIMRAIQSNPLPLVVVDTTASDATVAYLVEALRLGAFAVLANKKPLAGKQQSFDELQKIGGERLFFECTVGAGLPVIRPLKDFLMTGDRITEIQGCFSGTLGFIFSQLDEGNSFSDAVHEAKEKGFTEPDPRDDLSGIDVARKALILARLMGRNLEIEDISLDGLYPKEMQSLTREAFLLQLPKLDAYYQKKAEQANKAGEVLRFVAQVTAHSCKVGLQSVSVASDIGNLRGPDNIIVFQTERYATNPLVIKGPGAGVAVTAAGVFADVLSVVRIVQGGTL